MRKNSSIVACCSLRRDIAQDIDRRADGVGLFGRHLVEQRLGRLRVEAGDQDRCFSHGLLSISHEDWS